MAADLIRTDHAFLTGPVVAELLHGVKSKHEMNQLNILFDTVPCLDVEPADWIKTGETLRELRMIGLAVPLTDALIATIAIRNSMSVLTLDKHFKLLSVPLK